MAAAATKAPYGDVTYADPGYQEDGKKRYPLDTKGHAKAAWDYINQADNAKAYSASQLTTMKTKIAGACQHFGVTLDTGRSDDGQESFELRSHPTENLIRMNQADPPRIKNGRTLFGTVIPYGSSSEVRSWEGHFIEKVMPGAAAKTVDELGSRMKVLFNHGMDSRIGEWPIGKPSVLEERSTGVYAEVPVAETSYCDDLLALVDAGAIDGWSFRFSVPKGKETWRRPAVRGQLAERDLHEIKVPEFGPVTFPVYEASNIGIRSQSEFNLWQQLAPGQRQRLRKLLEEGITLGTSFEEAVRSMDTSADEAADEAEDEPDDENFDPTTPADDGEPEDAARSNHSSGVSQQERQAYVRRMQARNYSWR